MRALLLVIERRFDDDDDDDDAAASEMGELFSTTKAKVSLSLSLEHKTPNRAYARRTSLFRFTRMKKPLSLTSLFFFFFFERARLREHKLYYTLFCKNTRVFFSLSVFAWKK